MSHQFAPDVQRLIEAQMASGRYQSEDELLLDALNALDARQADFAAIQAGIEDMEAGRVRPISAVADEIRAAHFSSSSHEA